MMAVFVIEFITFSLLWVSIMEIRLETMILNVTVHSLNYTVIELMSIEMYLSIRRPINNCTDAV